MLDFVKELAQSGADMIATGVPSVVLLAVCVVLLIVVVVLLVVCCILADNENYVIRGPFLTHITTHYDATQNLLLHVSCFNGIPLRMLPLIGYSLPL